MEKYTTTKNTKLNFNFVKLYRDKLINIKYLLLPDFITHINEKDLKYIENEYFNEYYESLLLEYMNKHMIKFVRAYML